VNILVSGASGFVGSAIVRHLLDAGHQVRAMSRSTGHAMTVFAKTESGRRGLADGRLTFVQADVTKPRTLPEAIAGIEAIVQAAQFTGAPVEDPAKRLTYMDVDRNGTMNLLEAVAAAGAAPRFLYVSGITVSPSSPYTWDKAKWQAEEAIRAGRLEWTVVRCAPMYGKDDVSFNRLVAYSDHLPVVPIFGNGKAFLTPLFVEDIGRFFSLAVADPARCLRTTFGLGGPDMVTIDQFLQMILRAMGRSRTILHIPKPLGKVQGAVMQFLPGRLLTPAAVDFVSAAAAATDRERQELAEKFPEFQATSLNEGLGSYLRPKR
jgi:nucleoside-diphosphate-sugar epimerase